MSVKTCLDMRLACVDDRLQITLWVCSSSRHGSPGLACVFLFERSSGLNEDVTQLVKAQVGTLVTFIKHVLWMASLAALLACMRITYRLLLRLPLRMRDFCQS